MKNGQPRIAMISAHSCPVGNLGAKGTGGMSVYVRELARELGRHGFGIDIYTRVHDPQDKQIYQLGRNARLMHLRAGEDKSIDKLAVYPYLSDFARNIDDFRKSEGFRYDLIFSHYWLSGLAGKYLQQWWDVPHVMAFHTVGAIKNAIGIGDTEPNLRIETERYLARNCHRIISPTEDEKNALIQLYGASPERIDVIPCGVNLDVFQPLDSELAKERLGFNGDNIILYVGRIEPLKGIDRLLRARACLQNSLKIRVVIVGGDEHSHDEIEKLKGLARSLHLEDSVIFTGMIKHEELPAFYSAAVACVIPSYYESFGLVALESMACGTPVIANNVGSLRNIIRQGRTGYVLDNNYACDLADKIALLISAPDIQSALSIRASVSHFSWPNIAQKVVEKVLDNYVGAKKAG